MTKSFKEKLDAQFSTIKLGAPDYAKHLEHLYADYVELVTLFSSSCYVTPSEILDRLKDNGQLRGEQENEDDLSPSEMNDKNEGWINEVFQHLESRSNLFLADYPFIYTNNKIILKSSLSGKNELYIFLLISSNLDLFKIVKTELTNDFETISYYVLKNYLPRHALVKQFGKNSDYSGNAINKIRTLAKDLKIEVNERELENISDRNNQERGLDIIGWIPFSDNCPNTITILGQCACGKDWTSKHHDTRRFKHYLNFYRLDPCHAIFIPYALIGKNGGELFYRSDDIEDNTLVFERKRITEYFKYNFLFNRLPSKEIIGRCLSYVEDIV